MLKQYNKKYAREIIVDFIKIILFDTDKYDKIKYLVLGVYDGLRNKFGKLDTRGEDV